MGAVGGVGWDQWWGVWGGGLSNVMHPTLPAGWGGVGVEQMEVLRKKALCGLCRRIDMYGGGEP
jgi:hypothetical protein